MCFPSVRLPAAAPASPDRRSPGAGLAAPAPGGRGERGQRRVGGLAFPGRGWADKGLPAPGSGRERGEAGPGERLRAG